MEAVQPNPAPASLGRLALDPDPPYETCTAKFALQESTDEGTFKGMASVFGVLIDAYVPTRILPGAFTKTLREDSSRVRILYQHDPWNPLGKPSRLEENSDGLYIEGEIVDNPHVLKLMRKEIISELSIGFDALRWEMIDDGKGNLERHISELKLWEVSLVTFGANPGARIFSVHARVHRVTANLPMEMQALINPALEQLLARREAQPCVVALLHALAISEIHEGKKLSAESKKHIRNAMTALKALLNAAGGDDEEGRDAPTDYFGSHDLDLMELDLQQGMGQ